MNELFGIATPILAAAAAALLALVLMALGALILRRPLLARLGLRAAPRRRFRTTLIVLGLATSTAVITTAIGTGETMGSTLRAVVAGGVGPVDEIVVTGSRGLGAVPGLRDPQAVLAGSDLAAGEFFPPGRFDALAARLKDDPDIAALIPSAQVQATAISTESGRARTGVIVLGIPPGAPVFDAFQSGATTVTLASLPADAALINAQAAALLELQPGQPVTLQLAGRPEAIIHVAAVVKDGGMAGVQPAVYLALPALQAALARPDAVNQILVANRSGGDAAARSRAVTGRLRFALADEALLAQTARALATETGQSQLRALESRVRPDVRDAVRRLSAIAKSGRATPELAYYLADPLLTTDYRWVLNSAATGSVTRGRTDVADRIAPLTVLEVKQRALQAANEYGSAVTTVFLILGLFSIAASLLLVFLIFVMLAAERRTEMGLMRAVGVQRHHLVAAFAIEGLAYDLAASALGMAAGAGAGLVVIRLVGDVLARFDVQVHGHISVAGLVLSFCLGALVTFATVLAAAWRASRVNIIAAIHGLSDTAPPPPRPRWHLVTVARAALLPAAGVLGPALLLTAPAGPARAAGGALAVATVAAVVQRLLARAGLARPWTGRLVAGVAGPAAALPFAVAVGAPDTVRTGNAVQFGALGFVISGVVMALALVWAAGSNLDVLLAPVRWVARPFGSLAPSIRIAVAYPRTQPFRTGLTAAMFALVFLVMVAATALLRSTEAAYVRRDGGAGFDIRAQFTRPPADLEVALDGATAVRREDFTAIGSQAASPIELLWASEPSAVWRPSEVRAADADLLAAATGEFAGRAIGYDTDEDVWRALAERPGTAILARRDLDSVPGVREQLNRDRGGVARFDPVAVWMRDPRGGPSRRLTVVGVTADSSILPRGLLTTRASLDGTPAAAVPAGEFFLRVAPDTPLRNAATGIDLTFPDSGVRTRVLGDEARTGHAVRSLLDALVRGFLGMGLASGLAALGVVGMRSVAERRQQIGMLRALGFSRRAVQASFLLEGTVVALLGIAVGGIVGLVLARNVVLYLQGDFPQLRLLVPWGQIAAIGGAAAAAALISALAVAWHAGRVAPAEALRYE